MCRQTEQKGCLGEISAGFWEKRKESVWRETIGTSSAEEILKADPVKTGKGGIWGDV